MGATYIHFYHQDRNEVLICNTACMYCRLPNHNPPSSAHYIKANMRMGSLLKCSISLMDTPPNPPPPPQPPPPPMFLTKLYSRLTITTTGKQHAAALLNVYYVHRKPVALVLILSREASNQLLPSVHGARR